MRGFRFRKTFDAGGKRRGLPGTEVRPGLSPAFDAHLEAARRARTPNAVIQHLQQAHLLEPARTDVLRWLQEVLPLAGRHDEAREVREEIEWRAAKREGEGEPKAPPVADRASKLEALKELASLRERGHLTQEEFDAVKAKILG